MKRINEIKSVVRRLRRFLPALLVLPVCVVFLLPTSAAAVTLDVGTAAGQVGDTVQLPVYITGLADDVRAFEMHLTWSGTYAQCVGVTTVGTVSEGWAVSFLPGSGQVTVAGASTVQLGGDGVLVLLEMLLGPNSGTINVTLGSALLNEGDPVPTLANGQLQISALPTVNISPDVGLMVVGDSLQFSASGGTGPYTYSSSGPLVADFGGDSWLHAMSPGFTQATAEDTGGFTGTTTGQIEVRAFRVRVIGMTVTEGDTALVPIELDDPTGYGITAGELVINWTAQYCEFVGIETAGTIAEAAGWSSPAVLPSPGRVTVAMAGTNPLAGPGVLFYLKLVPSYNTTVTVSDNIFNETYPALPVSGTLWRTPLPTISMSPTAGNLKIGDQLQFNVTGSPTFPVTWSTDDPALATIDASGRLTALGEGQVRVKVVDNVGATAQSGLINICSFGMPSIVSSISASQTVLVPVTVSRSLDDLELYSCEVAVNYSPAHVQFDGVVTSGTVSAGWGAATVVDDGGRVRVYHAGALPLTGCAPALFYLEFTGLPGLGSPYTGVSLGSALFNEGKPCVLLNSGGSCEDISGVPRAGQGLRLWPNQPNPFNPSTTIRYSLMADREVDLAVFTVRGEFVRQLVSGRRAGGVTHSVVWDGRDDAGRLQSSGVYYYLLRSGNQLQQKKMVLLK